MEDDSTIDLCTTDDANDGSNEENESDDQNIVGDPENSSYDPTHKVFVWGGSKVWKLEGT